ncbi:YdaU family protein [Acetobacter ghanensis]|uniref:DUF1376 domain-containing protein n=1 Tax=Acetobacter ghanensis TaxID=431306 RepID=A0A0U5BHZ1_9PROT|nr:DUF1376 domain-containing protein [Acetobacter ghanensis]NHO39456.1 DUF1376 domain-containing protein [Acetobacter ghanensis]GBQ46455.1 hypothetical protein AA18895_0769 [Acetobacter ghanensis DSM 18895]CEF54598.1 hypothetical protein AGA_869 [Acetobacter ghanensis]
MSKIKTWMPVYIGDYLADTMRLSTLQHGAYFLLMMEYWRQGPLPDDMDELSAIARADRKAWDKSIWPTLKRFFSKGEDGLLHQKRMDTELGIASEKSSKRSAAANARWSKEECKTDANAYANASGLDVQNGNKQACKPHCTCASCASASPSPSHNSSLRSELVCGAPSASAPPAKPDPRGHRLPEDWQPSPEDRSYALSLGLNPTEVAEVFRNYWHDLAGAKARKVSWSGTWKNWCRQDASKRGTAKASTGKPQSPLSQQFERMQRQYGDRTVA